MPEKAVILNEVTNKQEEKQKNENKNQQFLIGSSLPLLYQKVRADSLILTLLCFLIHFVFCKQIFANEKLFVEKL